jgi:hypothetical protein
MLTPAPLALDSYYFVKVDVSINMDAYLQDDPKINAEDLSSEIYVQSEEDTNDRMIIRLIIKTDRESKADSVVNIHVEILGRFIILPDLQDKINQGKAKEEVIVGNAVSILFGSIRDQVHSLTAKMPVGPIFLPTATFQIEKAPAPQAEEGQPSQPQKSPSSARKSKKPA